MAVDPLFGPGEQPTPKQTGLLRGLTAEIVELDEKISDCKKTEKDLREQKDAKIREVIKQLTDLGQKSVKWDDGLMVIRVLKKYPRCAKEHWAKLKKWLMRNKYWNLATIHAQALAGIFKDRLERGQAVPKYVEVHEEDSLQVRGKAAILDKRKEKE